MLIFCMEKKEWGRRLWPTHLRKHCSARERESDPVIAVNPVCRADSGNHPDIIHVTHEKLSIGVDDIRLQVNADIQVKPYNSPYKIYPY